MKLNLKTGEHIRLSHDSPAGTFSIYAKDGALHVRAQEPGAPTSLTVQPEPGAPAPSEPQVLQMRA